MKRKIRKKREDPTENERTFESGRDGGEEKVSGEGAKWRFEDGVVVEVPIIRSRNEENEGICKYILWRCGLKMQVYSTEVPIIRSTNKENECAEWGPRGQLLRDTFHAKKSEKSSIFLFLRSPLLLPKSLSLSTSPQTQTPLFPLPPPSPLIFSSPHSLSLSPSASTSAMETVTTACSKESPPMINSNFNLHQDDVDSRLELGLGLSLGTGAAAVKFLTAQDLPAVSPHGNSRSPAAISGNKRAAHNRDVLSSSSPPAQSQVVGWPPIRTHRINNLATQNRAANAADGKMNGDCGNNKFSIGNDNKSNAPVAQETAHLGFVKVNMDGVQIGRKVDPSAHSSYESLAQIIEDMFFRPSISSLSGEKDKSGKLSKLLDGSSEFVLTYEDKDGDWMLVGDVPFRMFLGTVKRLRIMRTSEANGLAPRSQERNDRPRSKPI